MNLEELWQLTLNEMEVQLSRANFATWLKNSRLVEKKEGTLFVSLPNNFAKEWVENKYQKNILGIIRTVDSSAKKISFLVHAETPKAIPQKITAKELERFENKIEFEFKVDPDTNLNSRYTMDSFVVGSPNEMAYAAAHAIVQNPGTKYNPFFVYGGVGLGKTHLIQAIGNETKKKHNGKIRCRYVSSENFTRDIVWAIRNKRIEDTKKKYRDCDVLIIDDIQFISGKEKTMEEFFHTFNALYENNKQIIISSDRPPHSLALLEDRLRSRFEGGLIADIGYPDYEMRVAIVKGKLVERKQELSDEIIDCIARNVKKNVREVEGVLNKILFCKEVKQESPTIQEIEDIIKKSTKDLSNRVSDDQILKSVAEFYNIPVQNLTKRVRKKEVVEPRQVAMYLLRDILDLSYPYIGEKMGRDHTTAIHAVGKINQEINKNSSLTLKINNIKDIIYKN